MNCPNCHTEFPDESQFCQNCGASLSPVGRSSLFRFWTGAGWRTRWILIGAAAAVLALVTTVPLFALGVFSGGGEPAPASLVSETPQPGPGSSPTPTAPPPKATPTPSLTPSPTPTATGLESLTHLPGPAEPIIDVAVAESGEIIMLTGPGPLGLHIVKGDLVIDVAQEGEPAPGGGVFASLARTGVVNSQGVVAFTALVEGVEFPFEKLEELGLPGYETEIWRVFVFDDGALRLASADILQAYLSQAIFEVLDLNDKGQVLVQQGAANLMILSPGEQVTRLPTISPFPPRSQNCSGGSAPALLNDVGQVVISLYCNILKYSEGQWTNVLQNGDRLPDGSVFGAIEQPDLEATVTNLSLALNDRGDVAVRVWLAERQYDLQTGWSDQKLMRAYVISDRGVEVLPSTVEPDAEFLVNQFVFGYRTRITLNNLGEVSVCGGSASTPDFVLISGQDVAAIPFPRESLRDRSVHQEFQPLWFGICNQRRLLTEDGLLILWNENDVYSFRFR